MQQDLDYFFAQCTCGYKRKLMTYLLECPDEYDNPHLDHTGFTSQASEDGWAYRCDTHDAELWYPMPMNHPIQPPMICRYPKLPTDVGALPHEGCRLSGHRMARRLRNGHLMPYETPAAPTPKASRWGRRR